MLSRLRHGGVLVVTLLVAALMAGLVVVVSNKADVAARAAQRNDRLRAQVMLAGLTQQYLQFTFLEVQRTAAGRSWNAAPGDEQDAAALRSWVRSSPLHFAGAALTDLTGKPVTSTGRVATDPADPGLASLRSELLSGRPGLSGALQSAGGPLVALAVPVLRAGVPVGLLVGFADPTSWPLQGYTAKLDLGPNGHYAVLDGRGRAVASNDLSVIGQQVMDRAVTTPAVWTVGGDVYSAAPVGAAGWTSLTRQQSASFYSALGTARRWLAPGVAALLAILLGAVGFAEFRRHRAVARLADEAIFDPLTGAATRRLLDLRLSAAIARSRRTAAPVAVLFCDLDGFKPVNDRHGHAVGDEVLRQFVLRAREVLREDDFIARVGGDEFVVVLENVTDTATAAEVAQRLVEALVPPLVIGPATVDVGVSIGVARLGAEEAETQALLSAADAAMYRAKESGGGFTVIDLDEWTAVPAPRGAAHDATQDGTPRSVSR